ncbi:hypothetical protein UFOVP753_14 [uncultured Caudovirales phage]|uniref:Uncharacterized protein n=1 Tax=uncultured Caudovirales phage TaxID=2100421 RepID=A0A6J7X5M2_9CAUD|nr:hypothetical protein UFOVP753_14 [uncultured Caudovirales phage]
MANQEGVDIIIKATDQYTSTINKITASNELFGKSVKNIEKEIATLQKYMVSLKVNGMDTTSVGFKILQEKLQSLNSTLNQTKNAVNGVDNSLAGTANNLKKNNQQWTNLSLVIQDLPYGFRGIQNNLPALLGGFAAVTGPIYLAFSAIIAVLTVMDDKMQKSASAAKKLKEEQANLNDEIIQSTQSAREQGILLKSYIDIANDATLSDNTRNEALKKANELYGDHNQKLTLANINTKAVKESVDGYIQSLIQMAVAQKYSDQVASNIIKNDKIQAQIDKKKEQSYALLLEYTGKQTMASRDVVDVMADRRAVEGEIAKLEEQKATNTKELTTLTDKYTKSLVLATKLSAQFGKVEQKKGGKNADQTEKDKLKAIDNANKAEIKAFSETLDERDKKEYEAGLKLADNLQIMREAGYNDSTTYYAAYRAEMDNIATYYNNKEIEEARKTSEKIAKDAEVIDNRQLQNSLDALKIESDVAMKIANLSGNANAADRIKILEDYKNGLYDLASIGGYTAEQFDKIDDAIKRVDGAIEGSKDRVKDYTVTWQETSNAINNILTNLVRDSIAKFAENVGKAIAGEKVDVFGGFAEMIADGAIAIGKALIAYGIAITAFKFAKANPLLAVIAGAGLVAAGSFLKSKLSQDKKGSPTAFANGGIISGPTMGLMGEYPGASSNPEVVAPLDKLKSLIGGGGGTLEARISGNDLLILMNKANRNNQSTF